MAATEAVTIPQRRVSRGMYSEGRVRERRDVERGAEAR